MEYLTLGKVTDTFGLDGTLKVYSTTNNKELRYKKGSKIFLYNEKESTRFEYEVESFRTNGLFDFVKLKNLNIEEASQFKGFEIQVIKDTSDLKVGYYFFSDLEGCSVVDEQGNVLGIVTKVEEFPAQNTLRVKREKEKDFFVPFIKEFILNVDIEKKQITIKVIGGML